MFQYFHNVNAKVEEGKRYLTDVLKLELTKVTIPEVLDTDGITVLAPAYDVHKVALNPVVADGQTTVTPVAVHPDLPSDMKEVTVPTYVVPTKLKTLVRAKVEDRKQETAGQTTNNWVEKEVDVYPVVNVAFEDTAIGYTNAIAYYESLAHQLAQGDDIRHFNNGATVVRDPYASGNSRSH